MFVDTPATIAVLGAGPIGLEAALYARYLGYDVKLLERGSIADNVRRWGHVPMFSPFAMNASPLGIQALAAQDENYQPPDPEALLSGAEWIARYLMPLAQSDLIIDGVRENTRVISVARLDCRKGDFVGDERRADSPFRILVEDSKGQRNETADVVIDTTGTFGHHNWLGRGGAPALGETPAEQAIEYGLPRVQDDESHKYAGKRTLVIGSGYSAATNVVALAELASAAVGTEITWITKSHSDKPEPIARLCDDRLPARDELAGRANTLAQSGGPVTHLPGASVEAIAYDTQAATFHVRVSTDSGESEHEFDNIIANVGYRPDASLYEELQVHQCYATDGPMKLAAALLGQDSADCLDQTACGPQTLLNPEPNFYILGSKSYGRNSNFLVSVGLAQIRELFSIIAGRENLDLYATMTN